MKTNVNRSGKEKKGSSVLKTLLLKRREIEELLGMSEVLKVVENAFKLQAQGKAIMPPKLYLNLPEYYGDFRAMPAYIGESAGIKWVSVYPDNRRYNLPSVMATIILCEERLIRYWDSRSWYAG